MGTDQEIGTAFAEALAAKDAERLKGLLREDVEFRAMTPRRFWETDSRDEAVDEIILGTWFSDGDDITGLVSVETEEVGGRHRVGYAFDVTNADGDHLVSQQAFFETDGDQIGWLRIMCAGYQPKA